MSDQLDDALSANNKPASSDHGAPDDDSSDARQRPLFAELTNWRVVEIEGEASPLSDERVPPAADPRRQAAAPNLQTRGPSQVPRPIADVADEVIVLRMETRTQSAQPGDVAWFSVAVLNNGRATTTFTPAIEGWVDQRWAAISPLHTRLQPGASATFDIAVTPPRLPSSQTGEYPFAVVVRAEAEPGRRAQMGATLTVAPRVDFTLGELRPPRLQSSWRRPTASVIAPLTNHSNANLYVEIDGTSATADHRFEFAAPGGVAPQIGRTAFVLTPGQTIHVACRITPQSRRLVGLGAQRTPFRISAHGALAAEQTLAAGQAFATGQPPAGADLWPRLPLGEQTAWDASRTVKGTLSQTPLLGPGSLSALAGCALTLLLGVGLTGLVVLLALMPALRGQPAAPTQTVAAPPAALEIVVKIAEPIPAPNGAAPVAELPLPAANNVAQAAAALQAPGQPIVVQPAANPLPAQSQPVSPNSPATLPIAAAGEAPQVTADQITQPGQVYAPPALAPANPQADAGAPVVQPNMISSPGSAAPQPAAIQAADGPAANPAAATTTMTYEQLFRSIAQQYNLDWRMLAAQAYVESSFNPLALGAKGDLGLMQVLPSTWKEWAPRVDVVDPFDSYSNVLVAAVYLDYLRTTFTAQGYADPEWMLIAYNWGPNQVRNFLNGGGELENLDESLQKYARDVLRIAESLPRE
ncbi:MAG: transglycosylase SLT domain-containing protein [Caldilineaceae bacterium]